jgi:hypothetical protein
LASPNTETENAVPEKEVPKDVQPAPEPENFRQLGNHKIKVKKPLQRACNEKDAKAKICGGHLKRWFYAVDIIEVECGDLEREFGKDAEMYRCEHCRTLYLPNPEDPSGKNVAGKGQESVFGISVPPKA